MVKATTLISTVRSTKNKKKFKTILLSVSVSIFLLLGLAVGIYLIGQKQEVREKAAVPSGVAKVFISPETKTINVGDTFDAEILLDTADNYVSVIKIVVVYPYLLDEPPITVLEVAPDTSLLSDPVWSFDTLITDEDGEVEILLTATNNSTTGFNSDGQQTIGKISFVGNYAGSIEVAFDEAESIVRSKETASDILLIPYSYGLYTVTGGDEPTPTPSPTPEATDPPGETPTPGPTNPPQDTPTPISTPITTPAPTQPPIPESGIATPTLAVLGMGMLLIIGSILLAF